MARHLLRLKLVLLRGSLSRLGLRGKVALVIAYLAAVLVGLGLGLVFLSLRFDPSLHVDEAVPAGFGMLFLAWTLGPVLLVASENTLEVDRLALFPLGPRDMMPGLLLGSMVGFGGLATVLILAGAVAGAAPGSGLALVTVAAVALVFCASVAASRLVSTALSAATRKRRWRDVALTIVPLVVFAFNVALNTRTGVVLPQGLFRWLPSGPSASAVVAASEGRAGEALAWLALSGVVLLVLLWLWWAVLERVLTTAMESTGPRGRAVVSLFPRWARWLPVLPFDRVGAVAAKELRLQWRDPRRRGAVISSAFFALLPLASIRSGGGAGHGLVLFAAFPTVVLGLAAVNQYGFDGPRFWMHVAAGDDARADLLGKNLETALVAGAVTVVEALLLAAVSGGWEYVPAVLAVGALALGVVLGIGNVTSVLMPVAMPESGTNAWATNATQGMQTLGPVFLSMLVVGVAVAPGVVGSVVLVDRPVGLVGLMGVEAAAGYGAWRLGLRIGVRRSAGRQAELLAALSGADSG